VAGQQGQQGQRGQQGEGRDAGGGGTGYGLTRAYTRLPHVEAEIRSLPDVTAPDFREAVARARAVETLVHAIRRLLRAGDPMGAKSLGAELVSRAEGMVARTAMAQFPNQADDRQELLSALAERLWREVSDTTPRTEFWEVHFQEALIRAARTLAERMRPPEGVRHVSIGRDEDDEGGQDAVDEPAAAGEDWDDDLLLAEVLGRLEGKARLAAYLKLKGLKEKSNDPQEATIASVMGVSDRMVRNYLGAARAALEPWRRARHGEG
jgi:hypothetical protein